MSRSGIHQSLSNRLISLPHQKPDNGTALTPALSIVSYFTI
jgi:hypothetical protein